MTNENRRAAAARIRALLAKTVDNGCTEEEAMIAAAKAGELMDKYGIESSEVEIRAEKCETGGHRSRAGKKGDRERSSGTSEVSLVALAIARYCQCKVWRSGAEIMYFGLPHDVEIAVYMTDAIETAMRTSFRKWRKGPDRPRDVSGHKLRGQFMSAMAARLTARLDEMKKERDGQHHETSDGRSLVLVKNAVVEEQFAELGMRLRKTKPRRTVYSDERAAAAGRAAGDAYSFNAGIRGRATAMIGG